MLRAIACLALMSLPAGAQEFFTLKGHGGPIMDIAVGPDGQIATASFDNAVGIWTGQIPSWRDSHEAAVNTVIYTEDGDLISGSDDFTVRLWDGESSTIIAQHKGKVAGLAHRDGLTATASWDGTIQLVGRHTHTLTGHRAGINDVHLMDNDTLISASVDGTIRTWDTTTGEETRILVKHGFGINELVVTNEWIAYGAVDGVTRIIDPDTGDQIRDFTLDRRPILAMAFNAPTGRLAVGDGEGFIMVIDTNTWRIEKDFRATQRGPVWALAFSPDGQNIHAGGIDDIMYSWPVTTMDAHDQMGLDQRSFLEDPATLPNGERQFKRKCSICHALTRDGGRRAGPTLYKVFGRRAGTLPGYAFSETLERSNIIWSHETIDLLFDEGPDHYIPGSKMPMQRITKPQDRLDLIEYLATVTQPQGE